MPTIYINPAMLPNQLQNMLAGTLHIESTESVSEHCMQIQLSSHHHKKCKFFASKDWLLPAEQELNTADSQLLLLMLKKVSPYSDKAIRVRYQPQQHISCIGVNGKSTVLAEASYGEYQPTKPALIWWLPLDAIQSLLKLNKSQVKCLTSFKTNAQEFEFNFTQKPNTPESVRSYLAGACYKEYQLLESTKDLAQCHCDVTASALKNFLNGCIQKTRKDNRHCIKLQPQSSGHLEIALYDNIEDKQLIDTAQLEVDNCYQFEPRKKKLCLNANYFAKVLTGIGTKDTITVHLPLPPQLTAAQEWSKQPFHMQTVQKLNGESVVMRYLIAPIICE